MSITVGERVQLKTGGPKMTVVELGGDGQVYCKWFKGTTSSGLWFAAAGLVKV